MVQKLEASGLLKNLDIQELTGKSRSTIWRWVRSGQFPAPIKIGANSVAWTKEQYCSWLESRRSK